MYCIHLYRPKSICLVPAETKCKLGYVSLVESVVNQAWIYSDALREPKLKPFNYTRTLYLRYL